MFALGNDKINVIGTDRTVRKFYYVSNNEACEKNIAFYYKNEKDISIDGNGGTVLFDGDITGFVFDNCENIVVKNITVDYKDNSHFELKVEKVTDDKIYLSERKGFGFTVKDGDVYRPSGKKVESGLMMPYDEERARPDFRTSFYCYGYESTLEGFVAFNLKMKKDALGYYVENDGAYSIKTGQVLVFMCSSRKDQAFFLENCKNVTFENVNIGYSPSMGIVAQLCENVTLKNVRVRKNGRHGLISTCADATHFINCNGKISLYDCEFFNMLDDGSNFHGNYTKVVSVEGNRIISEIRHPGQCGVNVYKENDHIDVYRGDTISLIKRARVISSRMVSPSKVEITVDSAEGIKENDTVENAERMPEVYISGCLCGDNRPRAFLFTTPKKVVVENCEFSNCAHAIDISGDTANWFESGRVKDILIRNNLFNVCNYNEGDYPIWIRPQFDASKGKYYHENIRIENNKFIGFTNGMVQAAFVSGLRIKNNVFEKCDYYPFVSTKEGPYYVKDCEKVIIE